MPREEKSDLTIYKTRSDLEANGYRFGDDPWYFSWHGLKLMHIRGITAEMVRECLLAPTYRCRGTNPEPNSIKLVKELADGRVLHVPVAIIDGIYLVLTAFIKPNRRLYED